MKLPQGYILISTFAKLSESLDILCTTFYIKLRYLKVSLFFTSYSNCIVYTYVALSYILMYNNSNLFVVISDC